MNRKDGDDPNHLEGFGNMLYAEDLKKLNHLLEQLPFWEIGKMKEGNNEKGIEINIYEKGSWHVDNIENQHFHGEK